MPSRKFKTLQIINIILSLFLLCSFIIFTIDDILNVGNSYFWLIGYSCPFLFALLLSGLSLPLLPKLSSHWKYLPLIINILTVVVGIGLFVFSANNPDFGFLRHYNDYETSTEMIERGQIQVDNRGFATLPSNLRHTSEPGKVYVAKDAGVLTIYFMDYWESDGFSWGYLYRSDGSKPPKLGNYDKGCYSWRKIKPSIPKWFYCDNHSIYVFP